MNKVVKRLLVFFIGLPLVISIALWPVYNHLPLHILLIAASVIGASELYNIFKEHTPLLPRPLVLFCAGLLPFVAAVYEVLPAFVSVRFPFGNEIITTFFIFTVLLLLLVEVVKSQTFEKSNSRIAGSSFIVLYCGYLITFISRMTVVPDGEKNVSGAIIAVFLLMVFLCDSLAWFFGVLLGKNNRGLIKASPNKSIAGFIGGFIGSVAAGILGHFIWPNVFHGSIAKIVSIGICVALASIAGDLAESVFKRSAGVKDSGNIIPGRGGILDSMDSILMAAPVYYLLIELFYKVV